jgi:transaldolase
MASANMNVKIFADGADKAAILQLAASPQIAGFTTNPTLMRKAGITDYEFFARDLLETVTDRPISFEVFSDDFAEMERQAQKIASWGDNVYVKIPVTNTAREPSDDLVHSLSEHGIKVNVTALMTVPQVERVVTVLTDSPSAYVSVFAGRIADAGVDPVPTMVQALDILRSHAQLELIWASPRELFNVVQADEIGCHIITVTPDLLAKLPTLGKDLDEFSLDTVKMFHGDAVAAGYVL